MRKLTEVHYDEIRIGDKCISAIGTPGIITKFRPLAEDEPQHQTRQVW